MPSVREMEVDSYLTLGSASLWHACVRSRLWQPIPQQRDLRCRRNTATVFWDLRPISKRTILHPRSSASAATSRHIFETASRSCNTCSKPSGSWAQERQTSGRVHEKERQTGCIWPVPSGRGSRGGLPRLATPAAMSDAARPDTKAWAMSALDLARRRASPPAAMPSVAPKS